MFLSAYLLKESIYQKEQNKPQKGYKEEKILFARKTQQRINRKNFCRKYNLSSYPSLQNVIQLKVIRFQPSNHAQPPFNF